MKEFLNEDTLFNTIAMCLADCDSLILVVEGPDDLLLVRPHCTHEVMVIPSTGGRQQALQSARLAARRGLRGVRFLIDRDYEDFRDPSEQIPGNVVISTSHDCFIDLLASNPGLLQRIIEVETDSARRRPNVTGIPGSQELRDAAILLASYLAAVRIVDAKRNLGLNFQKFSFFNTSYLADFEITAVATEILTRSQQDPAKLPEIIEDAARVHLEIIDIAETIVGDHDLLSALARILKAYEISVTAQTLQKGIILHASCQTLANTGWFRQLQEWCEPLGRSMFRCASLTTAAA